MNNKEKDILQKCYNSWINSDFKDITPFNKYCDYSIRLIQKQRKKIKRKNKWSHF